MGINLIWPSAINSSVYGGSTSADAQQGIVPDIEEYKDNDLLANDLLLLVNTWLTRDERSIPELNWRAEAEEDYNFYAGDQDTPEVKAALQASKRPPTTYNEIKPKIDMLIGLAAQAKREPVLVPVGAEDEAITEVINGALKYHRYNDKTSLKEMDAFEHTVKSGRCGLYPRVGGDNPFEPEIVVDVVNGRDIIIDPECVSYNLNDDSGGARRIYISKWLDEDDIKSKFPNYPSEQIRSLSQSDDSQPVYFNASNEKYRLVHCWFRRFVKMYWFINPLTNKPDSLQERDWNVFVKRLRDGIKLPNGQTLQQNNSPEARETWVKKIYYVIFSGNFMVEHGPSPYKHDLLPLILVGAYKNEMENRWFGAISMAKDPQRGLNVTRRQLVHLLQTAPKGILAHETGVLVNEEEYDTDSAKPNFRLEITPGKFDRWKFTEQPKISPVYSELDALFTQSIKNLIGTQDALLGIQTSSREPGVTQEKRIETGIAVLYILFRNFRESRILLAEQMVALIQQYDSTERIVRIEGPEGVQLLQMNSQMNPQMPEFNDVSFGKYDARIDENVENATMRNYVLQLLTQFGQNNPGTIPPDLLMEYSNLPYSAKMRVREFNKAQAEATEKQRQEELDLEREKIHIKAATDVLKVKQQKQQSVAKPKPKGGK